MGLSILKKRNENEGYFRSANIVEENSDDVDSDMLSVASNSKHPMDSGFSMFISCDIQHRLV